MTDPNPKHWTATLACLGPVGHLPKAPGTWGTAVALPFAGAFICLGGIPATSIVSVVLVGFAVWCCSEAESVLQLRDPGCVVLDEFAAVPCCYLGPLYFSPGAAALLTDPSSSLSMKGLLFHLAVFVLFRFFDILKPWPVGPSQKWPRGWGVVMDDVLAAVYVNLVLLLGLTLI